MSTLAGTKDKLNMMRRPVRRSTAALTMTVLSSVVIVSFYRHLLADVDVSSFTVLHHQTTTYNLAVSEPETLPSQDIHRRSSSPSMGTTDSVLLLDWEVLILLPSNFKSLGNMINMSCLFSDGSMSPAKTTGIIPTSHRQTLRCSMPLGTRRKRPYNVPRIVSQITSQINGFRSPTMARWNSMVYEAVSTPEDIILFAKGINNKQGDAGGKLRCVFLLNDELIASTDVTVSSQEVFRCPHPNTNIPFVNGDLRVSIQIKGAKTLRSMAAYQSPAISADEDQRQSYEVCACTMVFNVAKFLREWVMYHSAVGVERFILYDNGSEDDIAAELGRLAASGYNISSVYWPWEKTQEAGFSHCAATHKGVCKWMAFIDVDEFLFSPSWARSPKPERNMLPSLLPLAGEGNGKVGQVSFSCLDFGPSGLQMHPPAGVTQGYTCRRSTEERHKSIVLLDAAAGSPSATLVNQVHHFNDLLKGWRSMRPARSTLAVYHYKYQAWPEFRQKFRRRVSANVADWRTSVNPTSRDRTPGLGFEPVEPPEWERRFCDVNDTQLHDTVRRWFGVELPGGEYKMAWQDEK